MKRVAATLAALALVVLGCGSLLPESSVQLITGRPTGFPAGGCPLDEVEGPLLVDPTYGTAIVVLQQAVMGPRIGSPPPPVPVAWPPGFTGRRVGSEVEVLDPDGSVVATTGHEVTLGGSYVGGTAGRSSWPGLPVPAAWWSCTGHVGTPFR